jgi:hypothetical protein
MTTQSEKHSKKIIEANTVLFEWSSAFFGIYWGVWQGFFVEQISLNEISSDYIYLYPWVLVGYGILIVVQTYYFVKNMWAMRKISTREEIAELIPRFKNFLIYLIFTSIAIVLLGWLFDISILWVGMGITASVGWSLVILFMALSDWRI